MVLPLFAGIDRTVLLDPLKKYAWYLGYYRVHGRLSEMIDDALTKPKS